MKNSSQPSEERSLPHATIHEQIASLVEQHMLLDYLLDRGFAREEAQQLMKLREHLYMNAEMRQRMTDDHRMQFARWLYEHGELDEM